MFSKIIILITIFFVFLGLFLTNLSLSEYDTYIHQLVTKIIESKTFFWICIIAIYLISLAIINAIYSIYFWNFIVKNFPERVIY